MAYFYFKFTKTFVFRCCNIGKHFSSIFFPDLQQFSYDKLIFSPLNACKINDFIYIFCLRMNSLVGKH